MGVKIGTTDLLESYIGGSSGWQPGANTTMYFKFNGNQKDEISGDTYSAGGITYGTLPNGNQYAIFSGNSDIRLSNSINLSGGGNEITMGLRFQVASTNNMRNEFSNSSSNYYTGLIFETGNVGIYYYNNDFDIRGGSGRGDTLYGINERHLVSQTIKASGKIRIYLDGVMVAEKNMESSLGGVDRNGGQHIGVNRFGSDKRFSGKMSELFAENREWTAQEISDYYNQTKANYGY